MYLLVYYPMYLFVYLFILNSISLSSFYVDILAVCLGFLLSQVKRAHP